nr:reverse transcriptase domain, reverse transcriptase zinc-binding domain protein [Tanacetum cinerariifolium]
MVAASKVLMLKPSEVEIWRIRIEQYIQMIDYSLWEVIENGATLPKPQVMEGVTTVMPITTVKEKAQRRNKVDLDTMSMDDLYNNLKSATTTTSGDILLRSAELQEIKTMSSRRSVPMEIPNSTALVSCDGLGGYDWSD